MTTTTIALIGGPYDGQIIYVDREPPARLVVRSASGGEYAYARSGVARGDGKTAYKYEGK